MLRDDACTYKTCQQTVLYKHINSETYAFNSLVILDSLLYIM